MEFIFEILFQFLGEAALQVGIELLFEIGVHSMADTMLKPRNPVLSTIGFLLWGALAGGLSLLVLPHSVIANPLLRQCNVLVTPLAVGTVMTLVGRQRDRKGQTLVRLDKFGYAFTFAFAMTLVRYFFAK
ncbi:MAG: hypothetical protein K2X68_03980 [Novosphingobium sp.]|nr:hypothetical protein [Novosphingobium sp.]